MLDPTLASIATPQVTQASTSPTTSVYAPLDLGIAHLCSSKHLQTINIFCSAAAASLFGLRLSHSRQSARRRGRGGTVIASGLGGFKTPLAIASEALDEGAFAKAAATLSETSYCSRSPDALRLRTLVYLRMGAFDAALLNAQSWRLGAEERWEEIAARLAETTALLGLDRIEDANSVLLVLEAPISCALSAALERLQRAAHLLQAWRAPGQREECLRQAYFGQLANEGFELPSPIGDPRIEQAAWHISASICLLPDWVGPVRVALLPNGQRGMVVTEDVPCGTLLMTSHPAVFQGELGMPRVPDDISIRKLGRLASVLGMDCMSHLVTNQICEVASALSRASPSANAALTALSDGQRVPDMDLDEVAASLMRKSGNRLAKQLTQKEVTRRVTANAFFLGRGAFGLWWLPQMMNHSCCPTANYTILAPHRGSTASVQDGGIMIVRAAVDMRKGDEVTHNYWQGTMDYNSRREIMANQGTSGFACSCRRCNVEKDLQVANTPVGKALAEVHEAEISLEEEGTNEAASRLTQAITALDSTLSSTVGDNAEVHAWTFASCMKALERARGLTSNDESVSRWQWQYWLQERIVQAWQAVRPLSLGHLAALQRLAEQAARRTGETSDTSELETLRNWLRRRYGNLDDQELQMLLHTALKGQLPNDFGTDWQTAGWSFLVGADKQDFSVEAELATIERAAHPAVVSYACGQSR